MSKRLVLLVFNAILGMVKIILSTPRRVDMYWKNIFSLLEII